LFADLRSGVPPRPPHETEERIWALWASHPDAAVARRLELATRAMAREEYGRAGRLLDPLVNEYPDWSEAWNRRATLHYLDGRDTESFDDIRRTLELEPRHFGAVCGFAQICLRRGERAAALLAFETALAIHPRLAGIRAAIDDLSESLAANMH
jgi:Tfp pilus assembly protein PilF